MKTYLLTGDIGGTNSRLSLYDTSSKKPLKEIYYRNSEHLPNDCTRNSSAFQDKIVAPFLKTCFDELNIDPESSDFRLLACLACAGPVQNNSVNMSNLGGLLVDGSNIVNSHEPYLNHIRHCSVINDFVAQGYGCLTLQKHEVRHLYGPKTWQGDGPKVCVGAGTGLGECYLTPAVGTGIYSCFPSEGGHVEFTPRSEVETKMWQFFLQKFDPNNKSRISVERVVSGIGLANVYEFLVQEFPDRKDAKVHAEFEKAGDMQGKVVAENATKGSLCLQAVELMMSAYGSEVGNAAIKWIPTGGLFVTGGLTPKNIQHIEGKDSKFLKSYKDKGRVKGVIETVPCFAVMVEDLGVRGAYKCAMMDYERLCDECNESPFSKSKSNNDQAKLWLSLGMVAVAAFVAGKTMGAKQK